MSVARHLLPLSLLSLAACSSSGYSPSLTMVRMGWVEVDEPPPIPEDHWLPGANAQPEEYDVSGVSAISLDISHLQDLEDPEPLDKHTSYDYSTGQGDLVDALSDEGEIQYDDVEQGAIGDCFFVASLAASVFVDDTGALSQGLIRAVPRPDKDVSELAAIPGTVPSNPGFLSHCLFAPRCPHARDRCWQGQPPQYPLGDRHRVACYLYESAAEAAR